MEESEPTPRNSTTKFKIDEIIKYTLFVVVLTFIGTSFIMMYKIFIRPISNSSSSSSLNFDIVFTLHQKRNDYEYLYVDPAKASILYGRERVCEKVIDPFYVMSEEEKRIGMSCNSTTLSERIMNDLSFQKSNNGTLIFGFHLEAVGKFVWEWDGNTYSKRRGKQTAKDVLEISCYELEIGFPNSHSHSDFEAQLISGSHADCKVDY